MKYTLLLIVFALCYLLSAQNTVGLLSLDADASLGGYNLIYPDRQSTVYLLDECGQIVHRWEDADEGALPGAVAYLLPDGRLLRAKAYGPLFESTSFGTGGAGGVIQLISWDNDVEWTYIVADSTERQHHDVHPMPNGNVLILAYERFELEAIVAAGFDTITNSQRRIWSEKIIEVDPLTDSVVWEWHVWDHLVQEHNADAENYGVIAESPHRIDLNYHEFSFTRDDWIHANAIDYNEELDQVMISARNFNEIWIIDHSTTTEEAATSSGGNSGRGGDLLWRWGSPHAYAQDSLSNQLLFWNHDTQWIDDFVDPDYEHYGAVAVFNNFIDFAVEDGRSRGQVIRPVWEESQQAYVMQDSVFLPMAFSESFSHPDSARNFSSSASSIQLMGDGHVIMCAARQGRSFELDEQGNVVWEYLTPMRNGLPFPQGSNLNTSDNFTFQVERYPLDYSAFAGRDLTPQGYIETNPNEEFCLMVDTEEVLLPEVQWRIYPNPTRNFLHITITPDLLPQPMIVYNQQGQIMAKWLLQEITTELELKNWPAGMYTFLLPETGLVKRVVVN
jgi:hypothetical protein